MVETITAPSERPTTRLPGTRRVRLVLAPVVVVTALAGIAAVQRPLWLDEAYTLAATNDLPTALRAARGSMGLYYGFIALWGRAGDSALWLRVPSLVAGAAAVATFTLFVARRYGHAVARWAGLGVACSYLVVRYAEEARSYALVSLLVVGAWAMLDRLIDEPDDRRAWAVHLACCSALPLLHGLAAIQLPLQAAVLVLSGVGGRALRRAGVSIGIGVGVTAAMLAVGAGSAGGWLPPLTWATARTLVTTLVVPFEGIGTLLTVAVLAGSLVLLREASHAPPGSARFRLLMPVAWGPASVLALLALSVVRPSQLARYALPSVFGVVLLLALVAHAIDRRHASRGRPVGLPVASITLVALLGLGGVAVVVDSGQAWPRAAEVVASGARPGDVIVFPTADAQLPFDAAWRDAPVGPTPRVAAGAGELGSARRSVEPAGIDEMAAAVADAPRLWVVVQPYMHVDNPELTAHPAVTSRFAPVERWELGADITVELLAAREV